MSVLQVASVEMNSPRALWVTRGLLVVGCPAPTTDPDAGGDAGSSDSGVDDAGSRDAGPTPRQVGTVNIVLDEPCAAVTAGNECSSKGVSGSPTGSRCLTISVSGCPSLPPQRACVRVNSPSAASPTLALFTGGNGTALYGGAFVSKARQANFRTVEIAWAEPLGWMDLPYGFVANACLPASALRWAFADPTLHAGNRGLGFCATGNSGGSSQVAYSLTHYGLGDWVDLAIPTSGPVTSQVSWGCDPTECAAANFCSFTPGTECPDAGQYTRPIAYDCGGNRNHIVAGEGTTSCVPACSSPTPMVSEADRKKWRADSVLSSDAQLTFPKTLVHQYLGCLDPTIAVTMALPFRDAVGSANGSRTSLTWEPTAAHSLAGDQQAGNDMLADLSANCIPRH